MSGQTNTGSVGCDVKNFAVQCLFVITSMWLFLCNIDTKVIFNKIKLN